MKGVTRRLGRLEATLEPFRPPHDDPEGVLEEWRAVGRLVARFIDEDRPRPVDELAVSVPRRGGRSEEPVSFVEAWEQVTFDGWVDSSRAAVLAFAATRVRWEWRLSSAARRYLSELIRVSSARGVSLVAVSGEEFGRCVGRAEAAIGELEERARVAAEAAVVGPEVVGVVEETGLPSGRGAGLLSVPAESVVEVDHVPEPLVVPRPVVSPAVGAEPAADRPPVSPRAWRSQRSRPPRDSVRHLNEVDPVFE